MRNAAVVLGLCLTAASVLAPAARAQVGAQALPDALVTGSDLTTAQEQQIEAYIAAAAADLPSADARVREAARDRLLAPLVGQQGEPSVRFRLEYSRTLGPRLAALAKSESVAVAVSALRIAGALSSPVGVDALVDALKDPRPAIRRTAASSLGATLATDPRKSVVPEQRLANIVEALEALLATEQDLLVVDGLVLALDAPADGPLRVQTLRAMARGMGRAMSARLGKGDISEPDLDIFLRAVLKAREAVQAATVDRALAADAAVMAGHATALAMDQLRAAQGRDPAQTRLDDLATSSEAVMILAHQAIKNEMTADRIRQLFPRALANGPGAPLSDAVAQWIGPNGRLTQAPYNGKFNAAGANAAAR